MSAAPEQPADIPDWRQQKERSNLFGLRLMVWLSLTFGRPLGRCVLYGAAAYFTLFSPRARRASRAYLTRTLGRPATWSDLYRHVLTFASTIHDRIYLLNGRFDLYDITVHGHDTLMHAVAEGPGALLIGAHFGSFEVLRALGQGKQHLPVAMLMYEDNARNLNTVLSTINPAAAPHIIPLGHIASMLEASARLNDGWLVGMLADRRLEKDATINVEFLGKTAPLPLGPWRLAAMLRRRVFFMAGVYLGGNRYAVHFEPLADFSTTPRESREAAMHAAIGAYAERLEHYCRQAPYNWFNFFDFWPSE
ncbi:MAG TPA: acyl-CoA synthetase [Rhodocyclaceae bacterium]|nr:acyl-CoA synthetase [Rhodocyclaceae bacterium]